MNDSEDTRFSRKKSVAVTVILTLLIVTTLMLTTFGMLNYSSEKQQRWTKLRAELTAVADQMATGLALPIWNIDRGQIDKVIESAMKNRTLYGIVVGAAGKNHIRERDAQWGVKESESAFQADGLLVEGRTITFAGESIGEMKVFATTKFVEEELHSTLVSTVVTILSLDIILTLSLYLLLWRNVLKPLQEVERYAVTVSSGGAGEIMAGGMQFHGELEGLRSSIRKMVGLLQSRYAQLQEEMKQRIESEERYRTLAETATDAIVTIDKSSKIIFVNAAMEKVFGHGVVELIGRQLTMLMPEYLRHVHEASIQRYMETGKKHIAWEAVQLTGLHRSGKEIPLEVSFGEFRKNGTQFFTGIIRDITERMRTEEALRRSQEKFMKAFRSSPDAILISAVADGRFMEVNEGFFRLSGYSSEEVLGRTSLELDIWVNPEARRQYVAGIQQQRRILDMEILYRTKSDEERNGLISGELIELDGEACILTVVRDITDRKRSQEELENTLKQMRILTDRMQRIREEESRRIAREVHDELGQAMTGLKMDIQWISKKLTGKEPQVSEKIAGMSELIDTTIHTVRRIATELRPGVLDDLGLVAAIEWQAEEFQNRTGIQCSHTLPKEDIVYDPLISTAVFRIFQETLTNIIRHATATHVQVTLLSDTNKLVLEVHDNGIGIPPEKIVSQYSLGLLGMRERASMLGGGIVFSGKPQDGTTITLTVPLTNPNSREVV